MGEVVCCGACGIDYWIIIVANACFKKYDLYKGAIFSYTIICSIYVPYTSK